MESDKLVTVRTAKNKGASAEYDFLESLQARYPECYLTKQRGFQLQYDIQCDNPPMVFEVKRLKGMSWNQAEGFFYKLESVAKSGYKCFLLFKSNHQPALVLCRNEKGKLMIQTFEVYFETVFKKHTPIQRIKKE